MRVLQKEHLADETSQQRTARLKHMSDLQKERLDDETSEQATARLEHMSDL